MLHSLRFLFGSLVCFASAPAAGFAQQPQPQPVPQQPPAAQQAPDGQAPAQQAPGGPAQPRPPAQIGSPEPVAQPQAVATVNGQPILQSEVTSQLNAQLQGQQVTEQQRRQLEQQVIESLIESRLIEQHLADQGPEVSGDEIEQVVSQVQQQLQGQGHAFEQYLQQHGLTEASLRERIRGTLGWQKLAAQQTSPEALRQHFDANRTAFDGTEVRARHLLLQNPPVAQPAQAPQAQQQTLDRAQQVRQAIDQGLEFDKAVEQFSDDAASKQTGGDLGFLPRHGRLMEPLAEAAFELEPGEISPPVQTPLGVHLIQVTERRDGDKEFAEVEQEVERAFQAELWNRIVQQMRRDAEVERLGG